MSRSPGVAVFCLNRVSARMALASATSSALPSMSAKQIQMRSRRPENFREASIVTFDGGRQGGGAAGFGLP